MAKKEKTASPEPEGVEGAQAEEGEVAAGAPKKKFPPKMMLIAGAGALVVLGGGGAGTMMLLGGKKSAHAESKASGIKIKTAGKTSEGGKKGEDKGAATITDGPDGVAFYTLPDLVVNIQSTESRPTFLKLKLAFEVADQATVDALEPNRPRLTDMFTGFLRELRPEDLAGSQGSWQLRQEIARRVNLVIAPAKIRAVLIQEMLVQ